MWCFHQETRIAFCFNVKTRWKSELQLQSGTPGTLQCYRGSETVGKTPKKAVFLSDSLSALQSLTSETPDDSQKRLMDNINELAQSTKVVLQWIPAHTGIAGNEIADQLGKKGRKKDQPSSHLSYKETRTLIRNRQKSTFIASIHKKIFSTNCLATSKQQSFV